MSFPPVMGSPAPQIGPSGVSLRSSAPARRFASLYPLPVIDQHVGNNDMTVVETKQVPESIDSDFSRIVGSGLFAHINRAGRYRPLALN
jgi:hypothetical protein